MQCHGSRLLRFPNLLTPTCQILRNEPVQHEKVRPDYVDRINRGIDHIVQNLDAPLKLDEVARAACLSPFHFHRIFRHAMGETLNDFVKRIRLERALYLMSHAPSRSLTEIALDVGFSSSSDFSRSFKARFGVPPSVFDVGALRKGRRYVSASSWVPWRPPLWATRYFGCRFQHPKGTCEAKPATERPRRKWTQWPIDRFSRPAVLI